MNSMKNRLLLAALLGMAVLTTKGQQLQCSKMAVDCGETAYKIPVSVEFELRNTGAMSISIDSVKTDCGCTKVGMTKNRLGAGETTTLTMSYDGRMLGQFVKQAVVNYHVEQNIPAAEAPLYLTMKGVVKGELKDYSNTFPYKIGELLTDKNVLEFDDVRKGEHPEQVINILNNSHKTLTPNMEHMPGFLTAVVSPERLKPGGVGKVTVTLGSEHLEDYGLTQTTVYLASQLGDSISEETELPVSVVLLPDLKTYSGKNKAYAPKMVLSTKKLELGTIGGKQRKKTEIMISNKGRMPLEIQSLQLFTGGVQLTLDKRTLQPQESARMKVKADLDILKKVRTKPRILMITNDPDNTKVVIEIKVKR